MGFPSIRAPGTRDLAYGWLEKVLQLPRSVFVFTLLIEIRVGLYSWEDKGQMDVRAITQIQQMSPSLPGANGNESK